MKTFATWVLYVLVMGLAAAPEAVLKEQDPEVVLVVAAVVSVIWLAVTVVRRRARREAGASTAELLEELYPPVAERPQTGDGDHADTSRPAPLVGRSTTL